MTYKTGLRTVFSYGFLLLLAIAATSSATAKAAEYGVIDGAQVIWVPEPAYFGVANYDQIIRVDDGAIDAAGVRIVVPGRNLALLALGGAGIPGVVNANFETTSSYAATAMAASTSYYVYAAATTTFIDYVISKVPPFADGYPGAEIWFVSSGTDHNSNNCSMVYLGSFQSYSNGAKLIGFYRMGEQVNFALAFDGMFNASFTQAPFFGYAGGYPQAQGAAFPAAMVPKTATALILDLNIVGNTLQPAGNIFELDPFVNVLQTDGANCVASVIQTFYTSGGFNGLFSTRIIAPIAQGNPTVTFGLCQEPSQKGNINLTYEGYVEPTHHLTFTHPTY